MTSTRATRASSDVSNKTFGKERPLNYQREVSVHLTPTREMQLRERQHNAIHIPRAVLRPGLLSQELQNKLNTHEMKGGERIFWRKGSKAHFGSVYLDENLTRPCHKEMKRLQELVMESQPSRKLRQKGKTGDIMYLSVSTRRSGLEIQPSKYFRNKETNKNDPLIQEMIRVMGSLVAQLFKIGLPPDVVDLLHRRSAVDVSLGAGHHDNVYTSQIQCNVSLLQEDLPTAIGAGGALHIDANNDPNRLSIVMFLSHLPADHCPGKFILPSESVYCMTAPYTAIICSGHLPHWPIPPRRYESNSIRYIPAGPIPQPPKDEEFRRISMVSYPERSSMNRAPELITKILRKPESLYIFGTKRNQHEFWARLQAKKTAQEALEEDIELDQTDVSQIILDNSWEEDGVTKFPRSQKLTEILFGDSDEEWREREKFMAENISCGYYFKGGQRKSEAILTDVEENDDEGSDMEESNVEGSAFKGSDVEESNGDVSDIDDPEEKIPTTVRRLVTKHQEKLPTDFELRSSSEETETDEISPKDISQSNTEDIKNHWKALDAVIADKDSETDQDIRILKDQIRICNSQAHQTETGSRSDYSEPGDSDDDSPIYSGSSGSDADSSIPADLEIPPADPSSMANKFRSLDDMSFTAKAGNPVRPTKRKRSLSESDNMAKAKKPWAYSPLVYNPESESSSNPENSLPVTTIPKGAFLIDDVKTKPWAYSPLVYSPESESSSDPENSLQVTTFEKSAFLVDDEKKKPWAYSPLDYNPEDSSSPDIENSPRLTTVEQGAADEKEENRLNMVVDGVLNSSISGEEYDVRIKELLGELEV